jgi:hypothetical protein
VNTTDSFQVFQVGAPEHNPIHPFPLYKQSKHFSKHDIERTEDVGRCQRHELGVSILLGSYTMPPPEEEEDPSKRPCLFTNQHGGNTLEDLEYSAEPL